MKERGGEGGREGERETRAGALARAHARLGADVVCYSFIVVDLHHLLLASLLALAGPRPRAAGQRVAIDL